MKGLDSSSFHISHLYGMLEKTATAASVCIMPTAILSSVASRLASYKFCVGSEGVAAFGLPE
jgi:hypothetical protein